MLLLISLALGATSCFAATGMPRRLSDAERHPAAVQTERAAIAAAAVELLDEEESNGVVDATEGGETWGGDNEQFVDCEYCGRQHDLNEICQPYCIQCQVYHEEGLHITRTLLQHRTENKKINEEFHLLIDHSDLLKTLEQSLICPDCLQRIKNHCCGCAMLVYDVLIGNVNP